MNLEKDFLRQVFRFYATVKNSYKVRSKVVYFLQLKMKEKFRHIANWFQNKIFSLVVKNY